MDILSKLELDLLALAMCLQEGGEHVVENHMKLVVIGIKSFSMDIYDFVTLTHISF
jgi:hypothetical protein